MNQLGAEVAGKINDCKNNIENTFIERNVLRTFSKA
jgi:hypothetical protein